MEMSDDKKKDASAEAPEDFKKYRNEYETPKPAFPGLISTLNKLATAVENECSLLPPTVKELVEEAHEAVREWNKYTMESYRDRQKDSRPSGEEESEDRADGVR